MRDLVLGTSLFVLLLLTLALPTLPGARVQLASAAVSAPRVAAAAPARAGAGFTTCPAETARRPATDIGGPGDREIPKAARLHAGTSASRMSCWTEQPQVLLFGYEAIAYEALDPSVAVLRVRPAAGYREVVLTGPIRETIIVLSDRRIEADRRPRRSDHEATSRYAIGARGVNRPEPTDERIAPSYATAPRSSTTRGQPVTSQPS